MNLAAVRKLNYANEPRSSLGHLKHSGELKPWITSVATIVLIERSSHHEWITKTLWPDENPYLYYNDQPNIATDWTGSTSIIGSCLVSGGYAAILEWIRNAAFGSGGFDNGVCKTAMNCLAAMLGGAISAILEGITSGLGTVALGCVNGLVSSTASTLGSDLCDKYYPTRSCWPKREPIECDILGIAVGAILGCVGGLVPASSIYSGIVGAFGPIGAELGLDSCHSLAG